MMFVFIAAGLSIAVDCGRARLFGPEARLGKRAKVKGEGRAPQLCVELRRSEQALLLRSMLDSMYPDARPNHALQTTHISGAALADVRA